jgi:hypothetical protein
MYAFLKTKNDWLIKVYDQGDDWQAVIFKPNGQKLCERWVTILLDENHYPGAKRVSLDRAFEAGCQEAKEEFDKEAILIT